MQRREWPDRGRAPDRRPGMTTVTWNQVVENISCCKSPFMAWEGNGKSPDKVMNKQGRSLSVSTWASLDRPLRAMHSSRSRLRASPAEFTQPLPHTYSSSQRSL